MWWPRNKEDRHYTEIELSEKILDCKGARHMRWKNSQRHLTFLTREDSEYAIPRNVPPSHMGYRCRPKAGSRKAVETLVYILID